MTPTAGEAVVVLDASALVALLVDDGAPGAWVAQACAGAVLTGPDLVRFEAADVLRRLELRGAVPADVARAAHDDLVDLRLETFSYGVLADRVWALRANITSYDASYVAVAELVDGVLLTLDERLARAPGPRCPVHTPTTA